MSFESLVVEKVLQAWSGRTFGGEMSEEAIELKKERAKRSLAV